MSASLSLSLLLSRVSLAPSLDSISISISGSDFLQQSPKEDQHAPQQTGNRDRVITQIWPQMLHRFPEILDVPESN